MSELTDLLEEFEGTYTAKGGVIEQCKWGVDENGLAIPTDDPKLFTADAIAVAEDRLGMPIPEGLLELWEWAGNREIWWVSFGFLPTVAVTANPHTDFEDIEGGRAANGLPELRPFPGLMIANEDRVKLVLSLEEEGYGHLWIWRGFATVIEHSTWTSLEDFIRAQINWLDGPLFDQPSPVLSSAPSDASKIDKLAMPLVVRHALSLRGPEHYWY